MKPVILYQLDGSLYTKDGHLVSGDMGYQYEPASEQQETKKMNTKDLADLKAAGFEYDQIIAMKKEGVI